MMSLFWPSNWRPAWWHDAEVRNFILAGVSTSTTAALFRNGHARFGSRFPTKSAFYRFASVARDQMGRGIDEILALAAELPEEDRAALATRVMLTVQSPDMAPALAMAAALVRGHAEGLAVDLQNMGASV
jgi:hypothetical protein